MAISTQKMVMLGAAAILLATAPGPSNAAACSAATLKGAYSKTTGGNGAVAAVGLFSFDGKSELKGTQVNAEYNGKTATYTFAGTYTVAANCTTGIDEKYYLNGVLAGTETLSGVIIKAGAKINAVESAPPIAALNFVFEALQ